MSQALHSTRLPKLSESSRISASFGDCAIAKADTSNADLVGASLTGAKFTDAGLWGTRLRHLVKDDFKLFNKSVSRMADK